MKSDSTTTSGAYGDTVKSGATEEAEGTDCRYDMLKASPFDFSCRVIGRAEQLGGRGGTLITSEFLFLPLLADSSLLTDSLESKAIGCCREPIYDWINPRSC
mmetsp:Transcript_2655/g.4072  ORF Transcript_2655/g.4072 Transcript_2655/m.4072 type:complete len:102 (-) Transcript_2655:174-479(-)